MKQLLVVVFSQFFSWRDWSLKRQQSITLVVADTTLKDS